MRYDRVCVIKVMLLLIVVLQVLLHFLCEHVSGHLCEAASRAMSSVWALLIKFLFGCHLFHTTPVSYLPLISQDRSMQTLELPTHTMSSVCPPRWCNLSVKSEPAKINKWNPDQKCCSALDGCRPGRTMLPDLTLFPNHMMQSDN